MSLTPTNPTIAPPDTMDEWPGRGRVLLGRYRLDEYVAAGSAAAVWRGHDTQLDRDVAIKLLRPERAADEVAVGRFRVEALATVRATHPNAVRVYDACSDGDLTFLVMEYVRGPSLRGCRLPVGCEVAAAIGAQVASALGAAHERGLVHRDVKPGNVLIDHSGWVKVVDFGIARGLDSMPSDAPARLATTRYAAPEQLTQGDIGPWTDVYGLGLTLWEAVVGRPAFDGAERVTAARLDGVVPDLRESAEGVPDALADVVATCTHRDPAARFRDGAEAAEALQAVCGPRPYEVTRTLVATSQA